MHRSASLILLSIGLSILIGGVAYEVIFAGIPYPDPTPVQESRYLLHARIGRTIETVGLVLWALGVINVVLSWVHKWVAACPPDGPRSR